MRKRSTRRGFARNLAALTLAHATAPLSRALGTRRRKTSPQLVFLGRTEGMGIGLAELRPDAGAGADTAKIRIAASVDSPSFLLADPRRRVLYAVSESTATRSAVLGYTVSATGALTPSFHVAPGEASPCYLALHPRGSMLVSANYGGGSLSFLSVQNDPPTCSLTSTFHNAMPAAHVVPDRQEASHLHCAVYSPDGQLLVAADLGTDELLLFRCDPSGLPIAAPERLRMPAGSGPRHLVFARDGHTLFCICELSCRIYVVHVAISAQGPMLSLDAEAGYPTTSTAPPAGTTAAEVLLRGEHLYTSTRGVDELAMFRVAPDNTLVPLGFRPAGVRKPRFMTFAPDQASLIVCGEDSDTAMMFPLAADGSVGQARLLLQKSRKLSCIAFFQLEAG